MMKGMDYISFLQILIAVGIPSTLAIKIWKLYKHNKPMSERDREDALNYLNKHDLSETKIGDVKDVVEENKG